MTRGKDEVQHVTNNLSCESYPLISVCIPTLNGTRTISETVQSVLDQRYKGFELVISDDNSSDDTLALVQGFNDPRIRVVLGPGTGTASDNWNHVVSVARGKYVKVMGQDDLLCNRALEIEVQTLMRHSSLEPVMTYCRRTLISPSGRKLPSILSWKIRFPELGNVEQLLSRIIRSGRNPIGEPVCVTFRRDILLQSGGFSGTYLIDLTAWIRLLSRGMGVFIDEPLCSFRLSRNSWSYALRQDQAAQTRKYFGRLALEFPSRIRKTDLLIGGINAKLAQIFRAFVISLVSRQDSSQG